MHIPIVSGGKRSIFSNLPALRCGDNAGLEKPRDWGHRMPLPTNGENSWEDLARDIRVNGQRAGRVELPLVLSSSSLSKPPPPVESGVSEITRILKNRLSQGNEMTYAT